MTDTVVDFASKVDVVKRRIEWIDRRMTELTEQNTAISKESNDLYRERQALIEAAKTFQKYLGVK